MLLASSTACELFGSEKKMSGLFHHIVVLLLTFVMALTFKAAGTGRGGHDEVFIALARELGCCCRYRVV
jgi:hypothetical protein